MKTKTKISKQIRKKTNKYLVETILAAKKNKEWLEVAGILSGPRKRFYNINLDELNKRARVNENILVPGKVLSQGEIDKRIKIIALNFSTKAKDKLLKSKIPISNIIEEIKKNPHAKGIKILKNDKNN